MGCQPNSISFFFFDYDGKIFSEDKNELEKQIIIIGNFLQEKLKLELHPDKVFMKTLNSGLDFLGWVNFPDHRVLRTATRRRMMRRIKECPNQETVNSYLGLIGHGNARRTENIIKLRLSL